MSLTKLPPAGMEVGEDLDFYIDMTAELAGRNSGPSDDTIVSVVWTVPSQFTIASQSNSASVAQVVLRATTPVDGNTYIITATITTVYPRTYIRSFKLPVKQR